MTVGRQVVLNLDTRKDARPTPVRDALALRYFEKSAGDDDDLSMKGVE